jgi:hypothetical protein
VEEWGSSVSDTVKLGYTAFSNISYEGEWDTGISREEWDEMTDNEREEEITQIVFNDIDVWVKDVGEGRGRVTPD